MEADGSVQLKQFLRGDVAAAIAAAARAQDGAEGVGGGKIPDFRAGYGPGVFVREGEGCMRGVGGRQHHVCVYVDRLSPVNHIITLQLLMLMMMLMMLMPSPSFVPPLTLCDTHPRLASCGAATQAALHAVHRTTRR